MATNVAVIDAELCPEPVFDAILVDPPPAGSLRRCGAS